MVMTETVPRLRSDLRADNYLLQGETKCVVVTDVLLRGPSVSERLRLPYTLWQIAGLLDGESEPKLVCEAAKRVYMADVNEETVAKAIEQLDKYHLLDNERYRARLKEVTDELARMPSRQTLHDERIFATQQDKLIEQIKGCFTAEQGPGTLPNQREIAPSDGTLVGAVLPHASYSTSGPCAAHGYLEMARRGGFDVFIVVGYNHIYAEGRVETLFKDVTSPLGTLEVDRELGADIIRRAGDRLEEGGPANYYEHSVDVHIPFIQFISDAVGRKAKFLPIILSNIPKGRNIAQAFDFRERVAPVAEAVRDAVEASGKTVCLIASGDFMHSGAYYGDVDLDDAEVEELKAFDRGSLDLISQGLAEGFYKRTVGTRYCCVSPVFFLMKYLGPEVTAKVQKYYTTWDAFEKGPDINSFAAIAFYRS